MKKIFLTHFSLYPFIHTKPYLSLHQCINESSPNSTAPFLLNSHLKTSPPNPEHLTETLLKASTPNPQGSFPSQYLCSFSSVQSLSHVQLFATPWTAARKAFLSITNSWSLLKLMSIESVMSSNHLILCYPLLLLPSIFRSITVFSNESVLPIRSPKLQFQHQSFQ